MSEHALTYCRCGLAMYAIETASGAWTYVCERCDSWLVALLRGSRH